MRLPTIHGTIDRRILINYRVDPDILATILPPPFEPKLVNGYGLAGICLIRLRSVRPHWVPSWMGIGSENAAHRVAVQWEQGGRRQEGVYILRRDTSSKLNALAGGRLFPGVHHHARFDVREAPDKFDIAMESDDQSLALGVSAAVTAIWPEGSLFDSMDQASRFFQAGSLGYSPSNRAHRFDGLELRCHKWQTESLAVQDVRSTFFDDPAYFPRGSINLDCALLMRGIEHEWHSREDLCSCYAPMAAGSLTASSSPIASA